MEGAEGSNLSRDHLHRPPTKLSDDECGISACSVCADEELPDVNT